MTLFSVLLPVGIFMVAVGLQIVGWIMLWNGLLDWANNPPAAR